jgi:hypothetical protein
MNLRAATFVLLILTHTGLALANDEDAPFFRLTPETAACIANNRAVIEAQQGSVIYVYPPTCPQRPDNPLSVFTTAEAPDIAAHLRTDDTGPDRLIILGRSQLSCFDVPPPAADVKLWRFYPETCRFEPEP